MAVVSTPSSAALVMVYQTGVGTGGTPITRQLTLNNIIYTAPDQAVYDAAYAIFGLSQYSLIDVFLRKTNELTDET